MVFSSIVVMTTRPFDKLRVTNGFLGSLLKDLADSGNINSYKGKTIRFKKEKGNEGATVSAPSAEAIPYQFQG